MGFSAIGTHIQPQKNGLWFFGVAGQNSQPFLGGTLCVAGSLFRLNVKNSGGVGSCSGMIINNLADFLAQPSGGPLLIPGQQVNAQVIFRDPADANLTGLSNGLQFTICP